MLGLDGYNQILVTKPFADDEFAVSSSDNHDTSVALTLDSSSEHHPLRSRSISPARRCNMPSIPSVIVIGSRGETQPRLTRLLSSDELSAGVAADAEEGRTTDSEVSCGGSDTIVHLVGPNDSVAGVALRYGVSVAALRRVNRLWPSDPIHLRTELLIPCGNTLRARRKSTHSASTDTTLGSTVEAAPSFPPDLVASSFVAARNMIISMLPARISLESLSSKASASEDHELDDFQMARTHKIPAIGIPFVEEGYELSTLAAPRRQYKRLGVPLSSRPPRSLANEHLDETHIPPMGNLHSRCISSSSTASLGLLSRAQPFAVLPVRTSQLEPEPTMELPVRRPRI